MAVPVPRYALQAIDIVLKQFFADPKHFITIGRSFFSKSDEAAEQPLGGGAVIYLGHFCAVHPTQSGTPLLHSRLFWCHFPLTTGSLCVVCL